MYKVFNKQLNDKFIQQKSLYCSHFFVHGLAGCFTRTLGSDVCERLKVAKHLLESV